MSAQLLPLAGEVQSPPFPEPSARAWTMGRCICCDQPRMVAPGPVLSTVNGALTLPFCAEGFARAERYVHRAQMRAQMGNSAFPEPPRGHA